MADAFEDRLEESLAILKQDEKVGRKVDVTPDRRFVGFDAYEKLIASGVDVVLLCTPPHFRPLHLQAAVEAGKHVFAEKPVAVDAPGVRSVLETCELAKTKDLSVVSGLCLRYDNGFRETVRRLHDGAIGEVVTLLRQRLPRAAAGPSRKQPGWTEMTLPDAQLVQLHLALGRLQRRAARPLPRRLRLGHEGPVPGQGRRHGRPAGAHRAGVRPDLRPLLRRLRVRRRRQALQQLPAAAGLQERHERPGAGHARAGPTSPSAARGLRIQVDGGDWIYDGPQNQMYQTEHDELFASIRNGKPINNGEYMARSTLLAIMGRMAAYTGQEVTWEMALNSKEDLSPARYDWDAAPPAVADRRARGRRRSSDGRSSRAVDARTTRCRRAGPTLGRIDRRAWLRRRGRRARRRWPPARGRRRRPASRRTGRASRPGSRSPA